MKKLFTLAMIACLAVQGLLAADRFETTITVAASETSGTAYLELFRANGAPCSTIESVYVTVASGNGTGTVAFATYDYGVATTIKTSDSVRYGTAYAGYPVNSISTLYTYPVAQNVVTGTMSFVVNDMSTNITVSANNVIVPVYNTQTNYVVTIAPYVSRQLKLTATQTAVAGATVYNVAVYVKEDPPAILK